MLDGKIAKMRAQSWAPGMDLINRIHFRGVPTLFLCVHGGEELHSMVTNGKVYFRLNWTWRAIAFEA